MDKRLNAKILLPLQIRVYGYTSLSDLQETSTKKRQSNGRHKLGPKDRKLFYCPRKPNVCQEYGEHEILN